MYFSERTPFLQALRDHGAQSYLTHLDSTISFVLTEPRLFTNFVISSNLSYLFIDLFTSYNYYIS